MGDTSSLACWDFQNLGFFSSDMSFVMDGTFFSSLRSDFSTGYLEDALFEFSDRSKRRRFNADDAHIKLCNDFANSQNCGWNISNTENFSCMSPMATLHGLSDESMNRSLSNTSAITEMKTPENEVLSVQRTTIDSSSSSSLKTKSSFYYVSGREDKKREKRVMKRVVYPFALIKPGGKEGDVTINDINERILMPPTRPVRHPVGDFACRPCVSAAGPGLSGKAVVALTKIHTQGRGTITIIRTKG